MEVARFFPAVLAGDCKLLRHVDISNRKGLASEVYTYYRCYSTSMIPVQQLLEERPGFSLLAEFPQGSDLSSDTSDDSSSDTSYASPSNTSDVSPNDTSDASPNDTSNASPNNTSDDSYSNVSSQPQHGILFPS
ncbi:uncharacterized protein LOC130790990 isoform X2 [Actinidia eriantha]|uniref:uncharacterized protein LOC130790990 isoform X2 n=1 Tax=Actinidia eriantha TaxID=165200 RepID=UPI00258CB5B5|nr:uncharacterized protein LOC130790990 isoform X2 [Actinidia eriantha]